MENKNSNIDSKENLGHGIKGEISTTANNLKSSENNKKNKTAIDKSNKN